MTFTARVVRVHYEFGKIAQNQVHDLKADSEAELITEVVVAITTDPTHAIDYPSGQILNTHWYCVQFGRSDLRLNPGKVLAETLKDPSWLLLAYKIAVIKRMDLNLQYDSAMRLTMPIIGPNYNGDFIIGDPYQTEHALFDSEEAALDVRDETMRRNFNARVTHARQRMLSLLSTARRDTPVIRAQLDDILAQYPDIESDSEQ